MDDAMPRMHYEQLIDWLNICQPVIGKKLKDVYDENSTGCMTCKKRDTACAFLRNHPEYI